MALVLLVVDDPWFADAIGQALESEGYRCVWVRDGAQALEFCQGLRPEVPSLYLGEAMMPVMSGLEFLQLYRGNPFPSLILGSAPLLLRQALDLGATQILQKPFRPELLLEKVSELMSRSKPSAPEFFERVDLGLERVSGPRAIEWSDWVRKDWLESLSALMGMDFAQVQIPNRSSPSKSLGSMALEWGEALWIQDLESLPLFSAARRSHDLDGTRAFFCVPLAVDGGAPLGTLELVSSKPTFISHLDARILKVLASSLVREAMARESHHAWGLGVTEFAQLLDLLILKAVATGQHLSVIRFDGSAQETGAGWETTLRKQGWGGAFWVCSPCILWWGLEAMTLQEKLASLDLQVEASVFDATQFLGAPQRLLAALFRQSIGMPSEGHALEAA